MRKEVLSFLGPGGYIEHMQLPRQRRFQLERNSGHSVERGGYLDGVQEHLYSELTASLSLALYFEFQEKIC